MFIPVWVSVMLVTLLYYVAWCYFSRKRGNDLIESIANATIAAGAIAFFLLITALVAMVIVDSL